jgi:hypothetical protein
MPVLSLISLKAGFYLARGKIFGQLVGKATIEKVASGELWKMPCIVYRQP